MKFERMFLVAFFGNYLVNNVAAALASLVPSTPGSTSVLTAQYITFMILTALVLALMTWWYLMRMPRPGALVKGLIFGIAGFVIAVLTALVTGIASVLLQTGSFSQVMSVLPNFGPYLISTTTLILLGLWVVPAVIVGWFMQSRMSAPSPVSSMPRPMI